MTDFKAKMHHSISAGAPPQTRGAYSAFSDPLAGFGGRFAAGGRGWAGEKEGKGRGKGGRGKWRGGKGRAPKLLLNQGPSEPFYATAHTKFDVVTHMGRRLVSRWPATPHPKGTGFQLSPNLAVPFY